MRRVPRTASLVAALRGDTCATDRRGASGGDRSAGV